MMIVYDSYLFKDLLGEIEIPVAAFRNQPPKEVMIAFIH
jgi:hypothetical protein